LKRKRIMTPREREIVAAHEAGHAIVASVVPGADPVHKISIVQRGYEALGHTLQLPAEDRYLRTRRELCDQLAVWVGGRAAEEVVFREMTTGGQNDLQHATEVARAMVAQYGMSESLGPVALPAVPRSRFLSGVVEQADTISEDTARTIDSEVKQLMTDAHERAVQILKRHRSTLDAVVQLLLAHEVVEGDEVRRLLDAEAAAPTLRALG
jgi:cell division protease FtsH